MRRAVLAAAPVLALGVVVAVIVGGPGNGGDGGARAQRGATGIATVQRRTLVDSAIVAGTLGYADERSIVNRLSGTVTWLPAVGSVVRPGQTMLRVDGSPVVLMDGRVPAYRALRAGVSDGADVLQLERGLRALGHTSADMAVDRHWDAATSAAVRRWQDAGGLRQTGEVELGRIVFAPGARRIAAHEVEVGSAAAGGAAGVADVGTRGASPAPGALVAVASATVGGAPARAQTSEVAWTTTTATTTAPAPATTVPPATPTAPAAPTAPTAPAAPAAPAAATTPTAPTAPTTTARPATPAAPTAPATTTPSSPRSTTTSTATPTTTSAAGMAPSADDGGRSGGRPPRREGGLDGG